MATEIMSETPDSLATRIGDALKFWGFRTASWLSGHLPVRFSYWVAARIGDCIYLFWHEHSGNAVSNMVRVLGPDASPGAIKHAARKSFHNYIQVLIDFIRIPYLRPEAIECTVAETSWAHLAAAQQQGKGAIIVGCHSGNWDFAGAVMSRHNLTVTAIADAFRPKRLDDFVRAQRARFGVRTVPTDAAALRALFAALKRNEMIMIFVDRPVPDEGVPVQFFGETAWVPSGPAAIALKTGAAIIPGYFIRKPHGHGFAGAFDAPIDYKPLLTGDKAQDIQLVSQKIIAYMEKLIARNPTQWYMFRSMWPRMSRQEWQASRTQEGRQWGRGAVQRWRATRQARRATVAGLSMGISVDPPVIEEWASGLHPAEAAPEVRDQGSGIRDQEAGAPGAEGQQVSAPS